MAAKDSQKEAEEQPPEGVDENLWRANRDLQKQMREQMEKEEAEKVEAAQAAAGTPPTTSTMPSQTVAEAGAANEAQAKADAAKAPPKK
jgi:hypothetical protein